MYCSVVYCYLSAFIVLVVCNFVCNCCTVREQLKELTKQYDKSENDLKALQSVGQVTHNITLPVSLHLVCTDLSTDVVFVGI